MSLDHAPCHLSTTGYVFYLWGCVGGGSGDAPPPERQFSSRAFTIATGRAEAGRPHADADADAVERGRDVFAPGPSIE